MTVVAVHAIDCCSQVTVHDTFSNISATPLLVHRMNDVSVDVSGASLHSLECGLLVSRDDAMTIELDTASGAVQYYVLITDIGVHMNVSTHNMTNAVHVNTTVHA